MGHESLAHGFSIVEILQVLAIETEILMIPTSCEELITQILPHMNTTLARPAGQG